MTFRLAFALALCSFAVGGAAAVTRSASLAPPPPRFQPAAGWIVAKPTRSEQPDTFPSMVIAVTTDDVAVLHPFASFVSLKRLRPRGIIIWATTLGRVATSPFPSFARARWPLRLSAFRLDRGWEGQPAPNIQQRLRAVSIGGWNLEVRLYFATQHPDKKLLAEAQTQLDRLLLPSR